MMRLRREFLSTSGCVSLNGLLSTALHNFVDSSPQFVHQRLHSVCIVLQLNWFFQG